VDGIRCLTKSEVNQEVRPRRDAPEADNKRVRFAVTTKFEQGDEVPAFRPSFVPGQCPLFSTASENAEMTVECKVQQRRANPSYTKDGEINHFRETVALKTETVPQRKLVNHALAVAVAFFSHSWIAHHQAMMFDMCVDNLDKSSIAVLIDFSMNYGHNHADAAQNEWWSAHQSTLLPVVVYMRDRSGNVTWAHSHVFLSSDISHSNAFVQHVMDTLIKEYAAKFEDEGQTLKNVHMWSDGCAAQFKNKNQFYWLTTGAQKYGIRLAHHFFQSCHGKGPSDSEGAVAKSALRHAELVQGIYVSF